MKVKTEEGIAESMPLSDIQQYNKRLGKQSIVLWAIFYLGFFIFLYFIWGTWYIIHTGAINNFIAHCIH